MAIFTHNIVLRKSLKIFKRLVLLLLLLLLAIYILLHFPAVQTWLAQKAASSLSEKLHTRVTVKKVDFAFFNKLSLQGVMVEDKQKDTLLYAGDLRVNITDWFFVKDKITLHYISLDDAVINMHRSDSVWNYQFLADYFSSPGGGGSKKSIDLDVKTIHLTNIRFNKIDGWVGQNMVASIKKADITIDQLDLNKKVLKIHDIYLEEPLFALTDYTGKRPPVANLTTALQKIPGVSALQWNNAGWVVSVDKLQLYKGAFLNDRETDRKPYTDQFDGAHIAFSMISGTIDEVLFKNDTLHANLLLTAKEKNGLEIKKIQSTMKLTPEIMEFSKLDLETNNSHISNYYAMKYNDFNGDMKNFLKAVTLEGHFTNTSISSKDLAIFAPQLANWNRVFYLEGNIKGPVDNISGKGLKIKSGNSIFDGDISLSGLPDINTTFIDLESNNLRTNYNDLVAIIPQLKNITQPQLSKLGNIYYKGNFTGFINDFVTYGTISTNLGVIAADLNMKLPENAAPTYSGKIVTRGFRLGDFINSSDVGRISLNGKVVGSGFALKNLNANFDGFISQVEYHGYDYKNLSVNGDFKKNLFTGHLTIDDPNLKIKNLDGTLSLSGKEIAFNLDANLEHANLQNIHFSKENIELSGLFSLNFTGNNIDNFLGTARIYDAKLKQDSTRLSLDSITLSSFIRDDQKLLTLQSNEIDAEISGKFTIMQLPDAFTTFLSHYYPAYIKAPTHKINDQNFTFSVTTRQADQYFRLLDKRINGLNNSSINGSLDLANSNLVVNAKVPSFEYDGKKFVNIDLKGNGNRDTLRADIAVDDAILSDSLHFPGTRLQVTANNDLSVIHLKTSASQTLNDADLNASIQTLSDGVKVHFFPSSFIVNNKKWELEKDGELTVRRRYLDANEIKFRSDNQQIIISAEQKTEDDEPHIVAKLENVNIGDFKSFVLTNPDLDGYVTGVATVRNPFGKLGIDFKGYADSFSLDNKYIGKVNIDADANTETGLVKFNVKSEEKDYNLDFKGTYNYKDSTDKAMDIDLYAGRINLNILEPYLGSVFSGINGFAQSNLRAIGGAKHFYLVGDATVEEGSLKVAYTQCRYSFKNHKIKFDKDLIDFGNMQLKDSLQHDGSLSGKIHHKFFKDFSFENIHFETDKMLLLNTGKKDNSQFYGTVIGRARMNLNGPLTNLKMDIDGAPSSVDSSHIYLPTSDSKESSAVDYIEFIQFGTLMEDSLFADKSTNIVVNMKLTANPACKIDVILDEETGDIIKGEGSGVLDIKVGNKEPLTMRGRYEITSGDYTFNFQTFLKKSFKLDQGSITWNGSPTDAIIDLKANYIAERVDISSLNPLQYSTTSSAVKQREDITIISHLTGRLSQPRISFEFHLPERSNLKNDPFIVKRLEDFENDENEMNKQVASLLLFNTFITGGQNFITGEGILAQVSGSIGGVVSGWLTNLFNKELQKATNGIISTYIDIDPTVNLQLSQLQANIKAGVKIFLSNRIYFLIGGNLDYNNPYAQISRKGLLTPDITIEWLLNPDGSLRVVGFNRTSTDLTTGQRNRSGIQLSYRKDFNKLSDIFKSKKKIEEEERAAAMKPKNTNNAAPKNETSN